MSTLRNTAGSLWRRSRASAGGQQLTAGAALLCAAATAALGACADGPTTPGATSAARGAARSTSIVSTTTTTSGGGTSSTYISSSTSSSNSGSGDTARVTLSISPTTTATFTVNVHKVQIVAGSVCDPRTSGYGPALWDAPCTPATSTVTVTAKAWKNAAGRPVVTFSPDLRFVPGKQNTIWLLDPTAASRQAGVLVWCPTGSLLCVDESLTDPTLVTKYDSRGYAYRRLKHFSGFSIAF